MWIDLACSENCTWYSKKYKYKMYVRFSHDITSPDQDSWLPSKWAGRIRTTPWPAISPNFCLLNYFLRRVTFNWRVFQHKRNIFLWISGKFLHIFDFCILEEGVTFGNKFSRLFVSSFGLFLMFHSFTMVLSFHFIVWYFIEKQKYSLLH